MTEAEKNALAMINAVATERGVQTVQTRTGMNRHESCYDEAICRLSEQLEAERAAHAATKAEAEAFRQEVSDAIERFNKRWADSKLRQRDWEDLLNFILPQTDPLVEIFTDIARVVRPQNEEEEAEAFRAALAARGLEVRKIGEGE